MKQNLFTIQEVSTILGVSSKTLRRWEESGIIKPIRTAGNQRRYRLEDVKKLQRRRSLLKAKKETPDQITTSSLNAGAFAAQAPVASDSYAGQEPIPASVSATEATDSEEVIPLASLGFTPMHRQEEISEPDKYAPVYINQPAKPVPAPVTPDIEEKGEVLQNQRPPFKKHFVSLGGAMVVIIGLIVFSTIWQHVSPVILQSHILGAKTKDSGETNASTNNSVLAATDRKPAFQLQVNVPGIFGNKVTFLDSVSIKKQLSVTGLSQLNGGIKTNNADINAGKGKLTASNVVYSIQAGSNIVITGDKQNPTISATGGVTSFQGQTGTVVLTQGNGIGISGTTITNTDTGSAQNIFKTITAGGTDITAGSNTDKFTFAAGSGISISGDSGSKTITIASNSQGVLSNMTTNGVLYATSGTNATSTAVGAAGTVLHGTGGVPTFSAVDLTADVTGLLPIINGGTGLATTPTNGQLLIGNGSGYQLQTLTAGAGIGITNGVGSITVVNNGVTTLTGTANQVSLTGSTGDITVSLPQDIATTSSPTFTSLILGAGNTGTINLGTLTSSRSYSLPDISGTICVSGGTCAVSGGIGGSGTQNYLAKFIDAGDIGIGSIYDDGRVGIGTTSPEGLFSVSGGVSNDALVTLNNTNSQDILTGSASGTTRFVFDANGNLNIIGGAYEIGGTSVLNSSTLGANVVNSTLTKVGALNSGSITNGFGNIDTGGNITAEGTTGYTSTGDGAGLAFSGPNNHIISTSSGALEIDSFKLLGDVTANGKNIYGINDISAGGMITFSGLGNGIVKSTSGVLSSSAVNLASGDITGTLGATNGGTGQNIYAVGDLLYANTTTTLAKRTIGGNGDILTVQGGVPVWAAAGGTINFWQETLGAISPLNSNDDLLLGGTATSSAKFAFTNVTGGVPTASVSAGSGNSATYLTGNGTLGTTNKQSLTLGSASTGNIVLNGFTAGVVQTDATGKLSTANVNLTNEVTGVLPVANGGTGADLTSGGLNANGSIPYFNSNVMTTVAIGGNGTCLTSNGTTPTWASCGTNYLQENNGAIAPAHITDDFLLGATATTSAKFAFANVSGGTPTASISGTGNNALSLTGNGTIATTNRETLTLGSASTGNILLGNGASGVSLNLGSDAVGDIYYRNSSGTLTRLGIGSQSQILTVNGSGLPSWTSAGGSINFWQENSGAVAPLNITDDLLLGATATSSAKFAFSNVAGGTPTASIAGSLSNNALYLTGNGTLATTNAEGLTIGSSSTGTITLTPGSGKSVSITGLGTGVVQSASGILSAAALDLGGTNVTGTVTLAHGGTGQDFSGVAKGSIPYFSNIGVMGTLAIGGNGTCLTSDGTVPSWGSCTGGSATNYFQLNAGALAPVDTHYDLLLGSNATASAKIAFVNVSTGTPTASISATATGTGLAIAGDGSLQSLQNGTLTIGGNTTGDILFKPGNNGSSLYLGSNGKVGIGTTNPGSALDVNGSLLLAAGGTIDARASGGLTIGGSANTTGLTLGRASAGITLPGFQSCGSLTTNGTGDLTCSGTPTGTNFWDQLNGVLTPKIETQDLLLGSNATTSAKFAVLNMASGTPTASVAGNFIVMPTIVNGSQVGGRLGVATNTPQYTLDVNLGDNAGTSNAFARIYGAESDSGLDLQNTSAGGVGWFLDSAGAGSFVGQGNLIISQVGVPGSPGVSVINPANMGGNGYGLRINAPIFSANNAATLDVNNGNGTLATASISGATSYAGLVVDNSGSGDLFTASKAGVTKFTILNNGNVSLANYTTCGSLTTNSSGLLQCGGTPGGTNFWDQINGVLTPKIETQDLLLGAQATTSAKFAFVNVNNGTPTASISGTGNNATYLTGNGTLGTTNGQSLTLGTNGNINFFSIANVLTTTGNLTLAGSEILNGQLQVAGTSLASYNRIGTGTSNFGLGNTNDLYITGKLELGGNLYSPLTGVSGYLQRKNNALSPTSITDDLLLGSSATASAKFGFLNVAGGTPTASISGANNNALLLTATGILGTTNAQTLQLGGAGTGNIALLPNNGTGGLVSVTGTLNASSDLQVNGVSVCLANGTNCQAQAGTNYWDQLNGVLTPKIETQDFLLGSNATTSAKFAVLNMNGGTPTASVAGNLTVMPYLNGSNQVGGTVGIGTTPIANQMLSVQGLGGADLLDLYTSAGTRNFRVDQSGALTDTNRIATPILQSISGTIFPFFSLNASTTGIVLNTGADANNGLTIQGNSTTQTGDLFELQNSGSQVLSRFNANGQLTIQASGGTTPNASVSGATTFASLLVDNAGTGDIFSASKSGASKFTILNNGNVQINNLGAGVVQSGATGILSSSALNLAGGASYISGILPVANGGTGADLTLSSKNADGSIPYFSGGVMTTVGIGGNNTCLISNGSTPTWGSCAGGATNFWQIIAGAISPLDSHNDLLVGGNATASAKFAFVNASNGTPTASIAGSIANNALSLTGNGTIATTNRITLALGGGGTGNISLQDERLSSPVLLTQSATGLDAGLGTNGIIDAINKAYEAAGGTGGGGVWTLNGNVIYPSTIANQVGIGTTAVGNGQLVVNQPNAQGDIFSASASGQTKFTIANNGDVTLNNYLSCGSLTTTGAGLLQCGATPGGTNFWDQINGVLTPKIETQDLLLGAQATTSAKFAFVNVNNGTPTASIAGSIANNALYLTGDGTLATTNGQSLTLGSTATGNITLVPGSGKSVSITGLGTGVVQSNAGVLSASALDLSGSNITGILPVSSGGSPFTQGSGAIFERLQTQDLLLGGSATSSAKFAFINVNANVPTASISANGGNIATYLTGNGTLGTTSNQSLTIGGSGTGNITLSPLNGVSGSYVAPNTDNQVNLGTASLRFNTIYAGTNVIVNGQSVCLANGTNCPAGAATYWDSINGALTPKIETQDLLLGSQATASAKFAVTGIDTNTTVASVSGSTGGMYLNSTGQLATTAKQSLILGDANTGNINFYSNANSLTSSGNLTLAGTISLPNSNTITGVSNYTQFSQGIALGGATTFNISNAGVAALASATLNANGTALTLSGTNPAITTSSTNSLSLTANSTTLTVGGVAGTVGLGTSSPLSTLDIRGNSGTTPIASFSGSTTNTAVIVDQSGLGDLFTASKSGATKFTILNNGNLALANYQSCGSLTTTAGGVLTCAGTPVGTNFWNETLGALSPQRITDDLLLGGSSTTSAKFAFTNNIGSGTPTASISAGTPGAIYLTASGTLATTAKQTLTLGDTNTGNINFYNNSNVLTSGGNLTLAGTISLPNNNTISGISNYTQFSQGIALGGGTTYTISNAGVAALASATLSSNGTALTLSGTNPAITTNSTNRLDLTANSTTLTLGGVAGTVGLGTTSPLATFDVRGNSGTTPIASFSGATAKAGFIVDNSGLGDIFTASKSGATKFTILNNGNLQANNYTANNGLLYTDNTGLFKQLAAGSNGQILEMSGGALQWANIGGNINFWQENSGAVSPLNITDDLLLGATATSSAKFAFLNNAGSLTPVASISAVSTGTGLSLAGNGTIQSLLNQTLTIGGNTTGDIQFKPGNSGSSLYLSSNGNIGIATSNPTNALTIGGTVPDSSNSNTAAMVNLNSSMTSTTNTQFGARFDPNVAPASAATNTFVGFYGGPQSASTNVDGATFIGLNAQPYYQGAGTLGTGIGAQYQVSAANNSSIITNAIGLQVLGAVKSNSCTTCAFTNNIGAQIYPLTLGTSSNIELLMGQSGIPTGNYGIYNSSTYTNYFAGALGLGTTSPLATLDVRGNIATTPVASVSGATTNAVEVVDQSGLGDLFTASKSGATKFTILNNGNLALANYQSCGSLTTTSTGLLTCAGVPQGTNYWNETLGALSPQRITDDLLLGGSSTTSAKFAFTNNIGSGTPTASISAGTPGATYLTASGTLATTAKQSLVLGDTNTGNINFYNTSNVITSAGNLSLAGSGTFATGVSITGNNAGLSFTTGTNTISSTGTLQINTFQLGGTENANSNQITNISTASFGTNNLSLSGTTISTGGNNSNILLSPNGSGKVGVNATGTFLSEFDVRANVATISVASFSGATTFANTVIDQSGTGDIFTASKSGATKFTILNNGNLQANNYTANNGLLYTDSTGLFKQLAAGTNGQVLEMNGGALQWMSTGGSLNFWQENSGAVAPLNINDDLLLGATATTSAKFAVLNVAGNTPVASISAQNGNGTPGLVLGGDGSLHALNKNTLTIGGTTTGDIQFKPGNSSSLYLNSNGNVGIGLANPSQKLEISSSGIIQLSSGNLQDYNDLIIKADSTGAGNKSIKLFGSSNQLAQFQDNGQIGFNTNAPLAVLDVRGVGTRTLNATIPVASFSGSTTFANTIIDQSGLGDLFTASKSGASKFTILNNGNIQMNNYNSNLGVLYTNGSGVVAQVAPSGGTQCLTSNGSALSWAGCGGASANYWQLNNNALSPGISSYDLLLGATATSSAKFAFTNNAGGTPTASISAITSNNALYLDANGNLGTTNRQSLTIGNSSANNTSGNILINPNGTGVVSIGSSTPRAGSLYVSGAISTDGGASGLNLYSRNNDGGSATLYSASGGDLNFYLNNQIRAYLSVNGQFGIGLNNTVPLATLDVRGTSIGGGTSPIASFSGTTSNAGVIVDQSGLGDIFTASKSGATKFTITNAGDIGLGVTSSHINCSLQKALSCFTPTIGNMISSGVIAAGDSVANQGSVALNPGSSGNPGILTFYSSSGNNDGSINSTNGGGLLIQSNSAGYTEFNGNFGDNTALVGINTPATPLAALDARAANGTLTVASVSGATTFANFVVDQSGRGDIFTASKSGATKFVINNAGNVGIGTGIPNANLQVVGLSQSITSNNSIARITSNSTFGQDIGASIGFTGNDGTLSDRNFGTIGVFKENATSGDYSSYLSLATRTNGQNTAERLRISSTGSVGIDTTAMGNATLAINQQYAGGDIFTASQGGNTKFTISNSGNVSIGNGQSILFNGPSDTAWTLGRLASPTGAQLLTTAATVLQVQDSAGAQGLMVRGNSNTSLFEIQGSDGQTYIKGRTGVGTTANGNGQFVVNQPNAFGDIFSASAAGNTKFTIANNGNVTFNNYTGCGSLTTSGAGLLQCGGTPAGTNFWNETSGALSPQRITDDLLFGAAATSSAKFAVLNMAGGTPTASVAGNFVVMPTIIGGNQLGGTLSIGTTSNVSALNIQSSQSTVNAAVNITTPTNAAGDTQYIQIQNRSEFGFDGANAAAFVQGVSGKGVELQFNGPHTGLYIDNAGNVNVGETAAAADKGLALLTVSGTASVSSNFTFDSVSAPVIQATNNQTLTFGGNTTGLLNFADYTTNNGLLYTDGSGNLRQTVSASGGSSNCLTASFTWAACGGASTNYWQLNSGALSPFSTTADLLLGGTSSTSADFAFKGVDSATPIASFSAVTNSGNKNGLVLDASGSTIQSLNRNTLTFGGNTTGDMAFDPGGSTNGLYLTSNGGVTVGNSTAGLSGALYVATKGQNQIALNTNGSGFGYIGNPASGVWTLGYNTTNSLATTSTSVLSWNTNGQVGIGSGNSSANLLATLDVRGSIATQPIASFSGATTFANTVIDQSGTGDLFTASKSGATKFVITNNGNVGIGVSEVDATTGFVNIDSAPGMGDLLAGGTIMAGDNGTGIGSVAMTPRNGQTGVLNFYQAGNNDGQISGGDTVGLDIGTNNSAYLELDGGFNGASTTVGIDTPSNPLATLEVRANTKTGATLAVASFSGATTFATTIIDQSGRGDIFTASKSGATKFTILNNGNIQFGNYKTGNGLLYTDSSGVLQQTVAASGGSSNCLTASFTWAACGGAGSTNYWQLNSGALAPFSSTADLLLGGTNPTATSSAGFHLYGSKASGTTPVASISANTAFAGLVLDQAGLGDLFTASKSGATKFVINNAGQVGIGTGTPSFDLDVNLGSNTAGAVRVSGSAINVPLYLNNTGTGGQLWAMTSSSNGSNNGTGALSFATFGNSPLLSLFSPNTTGTRGGNIGINMPIAGAANSAVAATLDIRGGSGTSPIASLSGATTNASLVIDQSGLGDIFTASNSGATKFTITNAGNVVMPSAGGRILEMGTSDTGNFAHIGTTSNHTFQIITNNARVASFNTNGGLALGGVYSVSNTPPTNGLIVSGNVGFGTASPLAELDVRGTNATSPVASLSGATTFAASIVDQSGTGDLFTASKSGATKFVITNSGNVGIGIANPHAILDISGSASDGTYEQIATPGTGSLQQSYLALVTKSDGNLLGTTANNKGWQLAARGDAFTGANDTLVTAYWNGTAWGPTSLVINPNGNIGVGTATLGNAELVVNQPNAGGDIFSASQAGNTKFQITNAGVVNVVGGNGTADIDTLSGTTLKIGTGQATTIDIGRGGQILNLDSPTIQVGNGSTTNIQSTGNAGITLLPSGTGNLILGQNSGTGNVRILPNAGGQAALIVNDQGSGDLFTASAGGTPKFTITSAGGIQLGASQGNNSDCLKSGGTGAAATWGTCATGTNYLQLNSGALAPFSTTLDLLLGATATNSAKFAVLNMAGGTPTASVAGNFIVMPTIVNGSQVGGRLGIGTNNPGVALDVNGGSTSGNGIRLTGTASDIDLQLINTSSGGKDWVFDTAGTGGFLNSGSLTLQEFGQNPLMEMQSITKVGGTGGGQIGINVPVPLNGGHINATLDVRGNLATQPVASFSAASNYANLVVDQSGNGDIFTASVSGLPKFVINNAGYVGIGTATPIMPLDINNSSLVNGGIRISSTATDMGLQLNNTSSFGADWMFDSAGAGSLASAGNLTVSQLGTGLIGTMLVNPLNFTGGGYAYRINPTVGSSTLATLDVYAGNGRLPVASLSGATSFAAALVDQSGVGDIFTASKSGATKFTIQNNGNVVANGTVGILNASGSNSSDLYIQRAGALSSSNIQYTLGERSSNTDIQLFGTDGTNFWNALQLLWNGGNGHQIATLAQAGGTVGIGTNLTGNGALVVNQVNTGGDIFSASASGTPRFTITNAGGLTLGASQGTSGQCLESGGAGAAVSWQNCTGGTNYWQLSSGALTSFSQTLDFLWGGTNPTATTSAGFHLYGTKASGTTAVASISANTSFAGLVVNNAGKGDLFTASAAGATRFVISNVGNVGIGSFPGNVVSPQHTLDLSKGTGAENGIEFWTNGTATGELGFAGGAGQIVNSAVSGDLGIKTSGATNSILFSTGGGSAEVGRIDKAGNFAIGTNFNTTAANAALDVRGSTNPTAASISGATVSTALVVDQSGTGDILAASKSGASKFTVKNNGTVIIGTSTNGIVFDPLLLTNPSGQIYFGTARPTKQIVLSPEYAGAVLTASGSGSTVGFMTSDASPSASSSTYNFENYYQWVSSQTTSLNDYTVAVRVTLPKDFSAWPTSNAVQIDYNTNLHDANSNKFDVYLYVPAVSASTPQVYDQAIKSATDKTWATQSYTGAQVTNWSQTNPTAVIYIKMYSKNNLYTQVGDIKLNYVAAF